MGVLVPPAIGDDSSLIAVKSTQQVPEDFNDRSSIADSPSSACLQSLAATNCEWKGLGFRVYAFSHLLRQTANGRV
jgi:hypothetical protein